METISVTLEGFPDGLTTTQTQQHSQCRREYVLDALKVLKAEKYVTSVPYEHRSNYPLWISVKPYREKTDPKRNGESAPGEGESEWSS
jgi:hypothetical protein